MDGEKVILVGLQFCKLNFELFLSVVKQNIELSRYQILLVFFLFAFYIRGNFLEVNNIRISHFLLDPISVQLITQGLLGNGISGLGAGNKKLLEGCIGKI